MLVKEYDNRSKEAVSQHWQYDGAMDSAFDKA